MLIRPIRAIWCAIAQIVVAYARPVARIVARVHRTEDQITVGGTLALCIASVCNASIACSMYVTLGLITS